MSGKEITSLVELAEQPAVGDLLEIVDISEPANPDKNKKITTTNLLSGVNLTAYLKKDGSVPLTAPWDAGSHKITAEQLESDIASGTAPLVVASNTVVTNLNADKLDGQEGSHYGTAAAVALNTTHKSSNGSDHGYIDQSVISGASPTFDGSNITNVKPDKDIDIAAGDWDYPTSNPAVLDVDTGTNGNIKRQLYDDTTEEFVIRTIRLPTDLDTGGTITFETTGYATTWVTGKNIQLKFYHSAKNDNESWDAAYATKSSGDLALNTSAQDVLDILSFTETVANLGWAAGDQVRIKLSRIAPSANNLSGDWGPTHFRIRCPRT